MGPGLPSLIKSTILGYDTGWRSVRHSTWQDAFGYETLKFDTLCYKPRDIHRERALMAINERARAVLNQVVTLHYQTCEPVGSSLISKTKVIPYSPATIRNVMLRLDTQGYLEQPHTSAGRLPTDLGYRTYVDGIRLARTDLARADRQALLLELDQAPRGAATLEAISRFIHRRTKLMTFHAPFRQSGMRFKRVHLERLDAERVLALWVSRSGQTFQTPLDIPEQRLSRVLLEKAANYFNNAFFNMSLLEIQRALTRRRISDGEGDLVLEKAAMVADALCDQACRLDNIVFQGAANLLDMPEFQDFTRVKTLFSLLERQTKIKKLVRLTIDREHEWLVFFIGKEMDDPDMQGLAVVLAKINSGYDCLGCVGAVGPKRMPYLRALQMLSLAKQALALPDAPFGAPA